MPWFADKDVTILCYRINRRPLSAQGSVFDQETPEFITHLEQCLLFGREVTSGSRFQRTWKLGNPRVAEDQTWLSGFVGWQKPGEAEQVAYDEPSHEWIISTAARQEGAFAPFVVVGSSQELFVLKHKSFAETTLPDVFEELLNEGEAKRENRTTRWAVEPLLDKQVWDSWLAGTTVLDTLTFTVKLPNPDAADSFAQIAAHLEAADAAELTHALRPSDKDAGLNKNFEDDPWSKGLMEMARRSYARIKAIGHKGGIKRTFDQREKVRRKTMTGPSSYDEVQDALRDHVTGADGNDEQ